MGALNDTLAPLVEEVNLNFIDNNPFHIIKDKIKKIDNSISNNSNEIFNIKTKLNKIDEFVSDNLGQLNISHISDSKYEELEVLI